MMANKPPLLVASCLCVALVLVWTYHGVGTSLLHGVTSLSRFGHNTDLILYSYYETDEAKRNLGFFLAHALHASADFILMLNGDHTIGPLLEQYVGDRPNIRVVERENRCYDLGGFHEVLTNEPALQTAYKRFMFMNASVRGPFFPPWANQTCWSDAYWGKLDDRVKIVGMTWNCANGQAYSPHIQSMILAFEQRTLRELLLPNLKCFETMQSAIFDGELRMAALVMEAGYDAMAMNNRFAAHAGPDGRNSTAFLDWCVDQPGRTWSGGADLLHTGHFEGSSLPIYETIFAKTNRDWDARDRRIIDLYTEHADAEGYSSYDRC